MRITALLNKENIVGAMDASCMDQYHKSKPCHIHKYLKKINNVSRIHVLIFDIVTMIDKRF